MFKYKDAKHLAEAIYDHIEKYGVDEIERIKRLLTGELSVRAYLADEDTEEPAEESE